MKTKYIDLITQSFDFPQDEFELDGEHLKFNGIDLKSIVEEHGTPLKFTYLPKISENIQKAKGWFEKAREELNYEGSYNYCYCTKSSHFRHILGEALKNDIHIETSSAFDINIVENLIKEGLIKDNQYIVCNGFKREEYVENIARLINNGHRKTITVIDNYEEVDLFSKEIEGDFEIGIRIASEEEPKFEFYTSRLGIGYKDIVPFYQTMVKPNERIKLKMLHFFINTGIKDNSYYWNELTKCLRVYVNLKKVCPELDSLNIGGGFPIKNSLNFSYDYEYMAKEILLQIKAICDEEGIPVPNIFTEFGSFTVGESGGVIYKILYQKKQNDKEYWDMIDSSFMTTLPDAWAISKRFVMLPINRWYDKYERVLLGGLTCDSDDYYNSEQHVNAIYLPKYDSAKPLYIGFFNTGAYQDNISGFGGINHCLIPQPKYILIDENYNTKVYSEEQTHQNVLDTLGYK
ncbi:arginine decarboxylase [Chishuiella sp.]|uniref:arginine decarboxylase n=1 Tax=Chishuiella sp. TaxID=1969467 RepID=UPI0028AE8D71|nr:arginine decarboxylase [Chishuiella sp.]